MIVSLLLAGANGFVVSPSSITSSSITNSALVPSTTKTATALLKASTTGGMGNNKPAKYTNPIREKRLSGIDKVYKGADGSTILGPSFRLALEIAAVAPLIWFFHSGMFVFCQRISYGSITAEISFCSSSPAKISLSLKTNFLLLYTDSFNTGVDQSGLLGTAFHVVLAGWIGLQANRVRTVFDDKAIEFYNLKGMGSAYLAKPAKDQRLQKKPDNWLVKGTPNRWNYATITGYRFYPSVEFPVVCILWEDQTGEGKIHYGSQPHFFPALMNAKLFVQEMNKHNVPYV